MDQSRTADTGIFPKVVLIDTVSHCDLRCSMCGHKDMKRKRGVMSRPLFEKIIDEVAERDPKARVWMVFFGEALILKRAGLFDMIAYAKNKGLKDVVLNSNANLLDHDAAIGLINSGLDAIYIGIDSFSEATYNQTRVGGNYQKVVNNVLHLLELKRQYPGKGPEVFVQFVEMDINRHEMQPFIDFWNSKGAIVKIRPMVSWAGLVEAKNLVVPQEQRWPCYWAMQTMSITNEGQAVLCAVDVDARFVAGNVNEQTLFEIWNGKLKELRVMQEKGMFNSLPFPCNQCGDWQSARADYYNTAE